MATTFRRVEALLSASGSGSGSWRKAFQSATANAIFGLLFEGAMAAWNMKALYSE